jgi:MoaA/NifB/PqqE/SkfB family radical SAM enzyme
MRLLNLYATLRLALSTAVHTLVGRIRGHSHVPHPRTMLFIEPTSHCNLECSFCTYRLDLHPRLTMDMERFGDYAAQARAMGFADMVLTPINGDVFMDRTILDKLRLLDAMADGPGIILYTNLIGASAEQLGEILALARLKMFQVSIYGHDFETFRRITGRGEVQFRRLLANLETMAGLVGQGAVPKALSICVRTGRQYRLDRETAGELHVLLRRLTGLGIPVSVQSSLDDWGGLVKESDLDGLDMPLIRGSLIPKNGACIEPFYNIQILADGRVNACACRSVGDDLIIGDLRKDGLKTILSDRNPAYTGLIERQQNGHFPGSCKGCSFYRSIYDRRIRHASPLGSMSLERFRTFLSQE